MVDPPTFLVPEVAVDLMLVVTATLSPPLATAAAAATVTVLFWSTLGYVGVMYGVDLFASKKMMRQRKVATDGLYLKVHGN